MTVANRSNIELAIKVQTALGSSASGSGATGIEVLPSSGLDLQIQSIESQMIQRSRMRKRARPGSRTAVAQYETELQVDNLDEVFEGVLGGTWVAAIALSNTELGTCTITGTGTIATFGTAAVLSSGIRAGMFIKFTNLSVAGNNSIWVPILTATSTVLTFPTGILADNASDAAYNVTIARHVYTATPYTDRYFTVEEYIRDLDRSKLGVDMKFNSLSLSASPDSKVRVGFGLVGTDMNLLAQGSSPNFTSPAYVNSQSLTLLDGGIYVNGAKRTKVSGVSFGLQAPASVPAILGNVIGPDVLLGQFTLGGQVSVVVEDATDFDLFDASTQLSMFLHCAEDGGATDDFVGIYMGNLVYAGAPGGIGGEGPLIFAMRVDGGEDERGTGYAATSLLVSTTAT